jgi:ADP-ribose pyrophosphatase YjhB (NUDIX family)
MKNVPAAGGIVLNEDGEILLLFRRSKWDLPKGHVQPGEPFEDCALREVSEETGLKDLAIVRFIGTTRHRYFDPMLKTEVEKETQWFEMRASKKEPLHAQVEESIEWIRWVTRQELPDYLRNSYQNIIEIFQQAGLMHA